MTDGLDLLQDWTAARIEAATGFLRHRVEADVAGAWSGPLLDFRMEDGEVLAVAFGGEHDFPIELHEGVESACTLVMDQVQDGMVDRLGRPWPELLDADGSFIGVLDVDEARGIACWALRGVPFCAVGQLSGAVAAAGWQIR